VPADGLDTGVAVVEAGKDRPCAIKLRVSKPRNALLDQRDASAEGEHLLIRKPRVRMVESLIGMITISCRLRLLAILLLLLSICLAACTASRPASPSPSPFPTLTDTPRKLLRRHLPLSPALPHPRLSQRLPTPPYPRQRVSASCVTTLMTWSWPWPGRQRAACWRSRPGRIPTW
jgi:hypothetical protein